MIGGMWLTPQDLATWLRILRKGLREREILAGRDLIGVILDARWQLGTVNYLITNRYDNSQTYPW